MPRTHRPPLVFIMFVPFACGEPGEPPKTAACISASDCSPTEMCLSGICVSAKPPGGRCTDHAGCPAGSYCDSAAGICATGRRACADVICPDDTWCEEETGECRLGGGCRIDVECDPPNLICEGGACVDGCGVGGCGFAEVCDDTTGRCVPESVGNSCVMDGECAAPTPNCNPITGTCYACGNRADCSGTTPECDAFTGTCFACNQDAQCASPTPLCDTPTGACIGCVDDSACSGNTPICHTPSGTCQGCSSNADCSGNTPACHMPSGLCLECVSSNDCSSPTPLCSGSSGTCVGCQSTGCPNGQTCNGSSGQCEVPLGALGATCNAHSECSSNVCVNYGQGSRCTRSCGRTADCDRGFGCFMVLGARMCIPPASASSAAEEIDCTTNNDCSFSDRCVWLEEAPGRWDSRCRSSLGFGGAQASCNTYRDCQNGICSVGVQSPNARFCRQPCDHDGQCQSGFFCTYIAHTGANYVQAAKGCVPVTSSFGACSRDVHCPQNQVCQVINYGSMGGQTYLYNGCAPRQ